MFAVHHNACYLYLLCIFLYFLLHNMASFSFSNFEALTHLTNGMIYEVGGFAVLQTQLHFLFALVLSQLYTYPAEIYLPT